jgi:hypothetical protein
MAGMQTALYGVMANKISAVSREKVKGTLLVKMSQGGNSMTDHAKFESKWLRSDCGNVK